VISAWLKIALRNIKNYWSYKACISHNITAKSRHPLEKGDPCLFNYLKRMDFALCPTWPAFAGMTLRLFRDFLQ
jgi:hypothetical protein